MIYMESNKMLEDIKNIDLVKLIMEKSGNEIYIIDSKLRTTIYRINDNLFKLIVTNPRIFEMLDTNVEMFSFESVLTFLRNNFELVTINEDFENYVKNNKKCLRKKVFDELFEE